MNKQLRKRMFKKRRVRRITFTIATGLSIELNTYALIRPTIPGLQVTFIVLFKKITKWEFRSLEN